MRVGVGYDSHRFADGRKLILGGVEVPHTRGLTGHSDADPIAHALIDALLGAAGLGDIGSLFPSSDPRWRDADSVELLRQTHERIKAAGYRFLQADLTVIAEEPKLGPHVLRMRSRLGTALGVSPDVVSIKAKSNEGMGWIGRGEGVAVIAVALLD